MKISQHKLTVKFTHAVLKKSDAKYAFVEKNKQTNKYFQKTKTAHSLGSIQLDVQNQCFKPTTNSTN